MEDLLMLIGALVAALNLMLIIKIWGACNDIKRIANKFAPKEKTQTFGSRLESKDAIEEWLKEGDK